MDKIAAYEMLLSEHPLWEDVYYHDKEAGLSAVRNMGTAIARDVGSFGQGIKNTVQGFRGGYNKVPLERGRLNVLQARINRGAGGAMPGLAQTQNTMTGNLFGQLGQDLAYGM